ncbi:MAG: DUF167 domain-containing protein [Chthoniobacterales bacterium]|jgi:uncharacterized protein (TIGR00251 family)|nr:DUF167 domain-containing protein [Verrucomicrobiota bacterium]
MTSCRLEIKAVPNAPRTQVIGWLGEALKVKVHAPALEGKANEELCSFLAETLGLPKRSVRLLQGDTSRKKLLEIDGLTREQVVALLLP